MSEFLATVVDYAWGLPLVFLLVGGGLILLAHSKFVPLLGLRHAVRMVTGKFSHEDESKAEGQISHFQALTNALAATIGLGNIAGVAVAITQGGAGAIFWMWVAAFIGANTKFFECTLSVMYRGKDYRGEVQGGPMYVIENALPAVFKPLAYMFAVCGLVGTMALFQINQLTAYTHSQYDLPKMAVGIVCAIFIGIVLMGGIKRIAKTTASLVPVMCVFYVLVTLVILILNFEQIPGLFGSIFSEAFTGRAALGGAMGMGVIEILKVGVKRAAFSNEAGVGTAPMAHSNVKTTEPVSEGYVAMLGPFLDTVIVCTMTALVILLNIDVIDTTQTGILLTTQAFEASLPGFGTHFLGVAIFLFSITTMVGMANYNEKCWNYLFKGKFIFNQFGFIAFFCGALILGSVSAVDDVVNILDIGYAFMAIPNMLATLLLAKKVKSALKVYNAKYRA